MAGEDKNDLKTLERHTDPASVWKAHKELLKQVSSKGLKPPPPGPDAKPEEVAAWRKDMGLPETPAGYVEKIALPNGLVMGEADKPIIERLAAKAHAGNLTPDAYNGLVAEWYTIQQEEAQRLVEKDTERWQQTETSLRAQWGPEYQANVNAILGLFPDDKVRNDILSARTPDGRKLGGTPEFLQAFAMFAREINPIGAVMPGAGGDKVQMAEARLAELNAMQRDTAGGGRQKYWSNPALQEEWRTLDAAISKTKSRAA